MHKIAQKLNIQSVKGQHDDTCAKCNSPDVSKEARSYLSTLPEMIVHENMLCVHDNPLEKARNGQGMWRSGSYIWSRAEADIVFEDLNNDHFDFQFIFVGHSHQPSIFSPLQELRILYNQPITLNRKQTYIVNPGSVGGKIRDTDASYSYLLYDCIEASVTFFRLAEEGFAFVQKAVAENKSKVRLTAQHNHFFPIATI